MIRWLDEHVQLRLSILLGWLFGRSVFFVQLLRGLGSVARYARLLAQPAVELLGPPLAACQEVALQLRGHLWGGTRTLWLLCYGSGRLLLAPLLSTALLLWTLAAQVLLPVFAVRS